LEKKKKKSTYCRRAMLAHELKEKEDELQECARVAAAIANRPRARRYDGNSFGPGEKLVVFVR
jgi:hypothetical protein